VPARLLLLADAQAARPAPAPDRRRRIHAKAQLSRPSISDENGKAAGASGGDAAATLARDWICREERARPTNLVALVMPVMASAHRPAIKAERKAMVYSASGRYYGGISVTQPRSVPLRCFAADIATVVRGSRWGAWTFSRYADQVQHAKQCRTGNGIAIEHKIGKLWFVGSFTLKAVPRAVAKDLMAGLR